MDELSPSPTPVAGPPPLATVPPPLPTLGGAMAGGPVLRQAWVGESVTFPMVMSPGRQTWKDAISDYRTGQLTLDESGCTLSGKTILPANIRLPILVGFLLIGAGWLIAYIVLEYAIRRDRTDRLSWNEIDTILVQSPKKRVCIIYHLPEKPNTRYALGLKMKNGMLDSFLDTARRYAPDRIVEGKIGNPTPLAVWILLGVFALAIAGFFLWGVVSP